ncbi:hypothetical protein DID88_002563 [Monilinia fructigena]|uniref:CAF1B/HIR1 beta-propeller domain-containing protein n=1 Tax=Monilinia fructigena TaxID=38457 RepID=A0A395IP67_9HELO|nr:hypothetical protein DID88_002563 [Monilinia fructigena]
MKATPLIINWHDSNLPIYSCDWEKAGKGRLATAGGDSNVRLWKIDSDGEDRKIEYLATLQKHTQAVNVVRWAPKGELLASAGDDGNVLLWVPSEASNVPPAFGGDGFEEKETWRTKHMCRSSGAEIYDLAWSPDSIYFIIGSMDNVARIYNAQTGQLIRQIAEHQHYVQGVAWDPLNEYIATQSSDRSVHIYTLRTKDGQFSLDNREEPKKIGHNLKMDLPGRRISSNSPAPPELGFRSQFPPETPNAIGSPGPSCPGTPTSMALPMNPPSVISHSRRSSFGPSSPAMSMRSASPAPSMPLPAVMPMEASPKPYSMIGLGVKNANIYANETLKSFFRRLAFTPDGSLLFTPAGQYQTQQKGSEEGAKMMYESHIYQDTKKPSVAVKCSPIYYTMRKAPPPITKHITIDTSSDDTMTALPEPAMVPKSPSHASMEPPPIVSQSSDSSRPSSSSKPKSLEVETNANSQGPTMAFTLPYRMVYAVATEDSVLLYDTQQQTPLCIVSNLHCATFTDLSWSTDGATLLMTSSDGFCSTLTFASGELGQVYEEEIPTAKRSFVSGSAVSSTQNTPMATPTAGIAPPSPFPISNHHRTSSNPMVAPSPPLLPLPISDPLRPRDQILPLHNPTPMASSVPGIAAANIVSGVPMTTPPQTPRSTASSVAGIKRPGDASESEKEETRAGHEKKKRRIAPTQISSSTNPSVGKP